MIPPTTSRPVLRPNRTRPVLRTQTAATPSVVPPTVDLDFRASSSLPSGFVHSRTTAAFLKTNGSWTAYPAGAPLLVAGKGWMIPGAFTQVVGNNQFAGAATGAVGSGGALPTGWAHVTPAGMTLTVVGLGTENGLPFIQLRFSGTNTSGATGYPSILFVSPSLISAASGQTWSASLHWAGVTLERAPDMHLRESTPGGSFLSQSTLNLGSGTGGWARKTVSRTLSNATAARVGFLLSYWVSNGESKTIEFKVAAPELYQLPGSITDAAILGSGEAPLASSPETVTRAMPLTTPFSFRIQARTAPFDPGVGQQIVTWSVDVNNWLRVIRRTATNVVDVEVWTPAGHVANLSLGAVGHDTAFAVAARIDRNDCAASLNGGAIVKDLSGDPPGPLATLTLGAHPDGNRPWWGWAEALTVWPEAKSDAALAELSLPSA
jgi:hypothetical protein